MKRPKGRVNSAESTDACPPGDPPPVGTSASFPIAGIGASAGGMESFIELFRNLPQPCGMAFVLIQHLDPSQPSYLSEALSRSTTFPVHVIQDGVHAEPDHVYVMPSNADVGVLNGTLTLLPRFPEERKPHLPIDFFFKALAADLGNQAIGVVLSGTGSDGAEGLRAIRAAGGVTFTQDPKTAKFNGMPEAAVRTGAVDFTLPIAALAGELVRTSHHPHFREREPDALAEPAGDSDLRKVFVLLRSARGVDFSEYKRASIERRLARRVALRRLSTIGEYVRVLQAEPAEVQALFEDILIPVTSFFRDVTVFDTLKVHAFPEILKQKDAGGTIRLWSAGCSTGEEAYSLVIALLEFLSEQHAEGVPVQLFGTDVSEHAIERARAGFYPEGVTRDVSPKRLARFFSKVEGGGYRISKMIRECCAFVTHNLASDPPFSKLDLVCCRNVLIYFNQELQKRVLATFHFSLNEPGFLVLGHAENIPDGTNLFKPIDKKDKIFARTAVKSTLWLAPARGAQPVAQPFVEPRPPASADIVRRTENLLLDRYAPPGVIVNGHMEILHFRGRTGPYLEPTPGQPQHDLLKMARRGLLADLRIGLSQAARQQATVRRSGVHVEQNGSTRICDVVIVPISSSSDSRQEVFAVLFEPQAQPDVTKRAEPTPPVDGDRHTDEPTRVARLEDELESTKAHLQSIIGEHERTNEDLLSANEELVSSNEELQSLNEELQTAKEELQSTNEELSTLNEELHTRNVELNLVNSDVLNLLASIEVPIVIVDANRRIRRFTPRARPILNLLPTDVGRPIDDIKPAINVENLDRKIAEVIETLVLSEEEVQSRDGRWFRLQIRPYTTVDKRIDGAVLSVIDIDVLKRAIGAAEWARDYAKATLEAVQTPFVLLDERFEAVSTNSAFEEQYSVPHEAVTSRSLQDIVRGLFDTPVVRSALASLRERHESFQQLVVEWELPRLGRRSVSLSGRSVRTQAGGSLTLVAVEDITERHRVDEERTMLLGETERAKASAEQANRAKDMFLATLSHELRTPLSTLLFSSQLLRKGGMDEARIQRMAETIERATKMQSQLIDDLLDISRIVTGKLNLEVQAVDLTAVVRTAVDTVGASAERKQVSIAVQLDDALPPVSGDPARLQQVVLNLLANAIKFTPERGHVTVTVDASDGYGRIRVADTGMGIEPAFLPHVFNRFTQEEPGRTRTYGGLGLGLAIVRHLIEAHGGTVRAESAGKGNGSTFTVLLPLMKRSRARPPSGARALGGDKVAGNIEGVRVLVVDDDTGTREALAEMLSLSGADVRSTESAASAMNVFESFRPELLLCDVAMPGEDGYSLLGRIRALGPDRGGDIPALALTALAGEDDRRRASETGFQAHLAKPTDIDRLIEVMTTLLKQRPPPPDLRARSAEA